MGGAGWQMPSLREVNLFPFRHRRKTLLSVIGLYDRSPARVLGVRGQTRTGPFRVGAVAQKSRQIRIVVGVSGSVRREDPSRGKDEGTWQIAQVVIWKR